MEKQLIYFNEQEAQREIDSRKRAHEAIKDLKEAYDKLNLVDPFSKAICIGLLEQGIYYLTLIGAEQRSMANWFKEHKAPPTVYGSVNFGIDLSSLHVPIIHVKKSLNQYKGERFEISPYTVKFEGSEPVFTEQEQEAIREKNRFYIENKEQKKLFEMVQAFCNTCNQLNKFLLKQDYPGIIEGMTLQSAEIYLDYQDTGEDLIFIPSPTVFKTLEGIKNNRNGRDITHIHAT